MSDLAPHIDWQFLSGASALEVRPGDLISADAGGLPIYRVMSLEGDRAWLRNLETGADVVTSLYAFHWRAST